MLLLILLVIDQKLYFSIIGVLGTNWVNIVDIWRIGLDTKNENETKSSKYVLT